MEKTIISTIEINASPEMVWDALINPEQTKKYMFGCEAVSDWKVGSPLTWEAIYEGKNMVFVKGFVLTFIPFKQLTYSVFDPNNKQMEDIAQNYLQVNYQLKPHVNGTLLTVTQGDYNLVADGDKRYNEAYNNGEGWSPILNQIKKLLENN